MKMMMGWKNKSQSPGIHLWRKNRAHPLKPIYIKLGMGVPFSQ